MSNSAAAEEPPQKKGKISPPPLSSSSWSPLSSLPDEMILNCLARVSRSDQASLSLVSKNYRSLMASPELHNTRSLLGFTENSVYVCLLTPTNPTPNWFILHTNHRILRPIPSLSSQATEGSSVLALDSGIYVIGGRLNGKRTSDVGFLDCRTHKWRKLPSMGVARSSAAAGVVKGKIYVFGGCREADSSKWAEMFEPKTQLWDTLTPIPDREMLRYYLHDSVVVNDEKVYGVGAVDDTLYYSPSEGKWGRGFNPPRQGNRRDWCVIDEKLIFCIDFRGNLCWSETEQLELVTTTTTKFWKEVKGLGSLNETLSSSRLAQFDRIFEGMWESYKITIGKVEMLVDLLPGARLCSRSNSGSNILLFWDVVIEEEGDHRLEIWCAEISVERRCQGAEIWGNVEWSNVVMTVNPFVDHYKVLCSVSVTL